MKIELTIVAIHKETDFVTGKTLMVEGDNLRQVDLRGWFMMQYQVLQAHLDQQEENYRSREE